MNEQQPTTQTAAEFEREAIDCSEQAEEMAGYKGIDIGWDDSVESFESNLTLATEMSGKSLNVWEAGGIKSWCLELEAVLDLPEVPRAGF